LLICIITENNIIIRQVNFHSIVNEVFEQDFIIDRENQQYLVFRNCHFKKTFQVRNCDFGNEIRLEDCRFDNDIIIEKSTAVEEYPLLRKVSRKVVNSIDINRCDCNASIILQNLKLNNAVLLQNSTFRQVYIESVECLSNGIRLADTGIDGYLQCSRSRFETNFQVTGGTVAGDLILNELHGSAIILGGEFRQSVRINAFQSNPTEFFSGLRFNGARCYGGVEVESAGGKYILLSESEFRGKVTISAFENEFPREKEDLEIIDVFNVKTSYEINFTGTNEKKSSRPGIRQSIKAINVRMSSEFSGFIKFHDFHVTDTILLTGDNENGKLYFKNIYTGNLSFENLKNYGKIELMNLRSSGGRIGLINSQLEKTVFINADINSFEQLYFSQSSISHLDIKNSKWISPKKLKVDAKEYQEIKLQEMDYFRQMSKVWEKEGDYHLFREYDALTHKTYSYTLSWTGDFSKKLALKLNHFTNRFGLEWVRPVVIAAIVWLTVYSLYFMGLSGLRNVGLFWESPDFWRGAVEYLWLPSLQGGFDLIFLSEESWTAYCVILFLFGKIALAYLIFQAISAFRKEGKMS
ncbi:MAG: hypothetical protein LUD76_04900, partial [Alistipes sp.]|nr:hypothetical protein [Alistipes sp.]